MKQGMLAGLAAGGLALATAPANAMPVSITKAGTLTLGSLTFSDFGCTKTGGGLPAGCGGIKVDTDAALPGLQFQADFVDGGFGYAGEDFLISYAVTSSAPITGLDLDFNGSAESFSWGGWAIASVTETAYTSDGGTQVGQLTVSCTDPGECDNASRHAVLSIGGYTSLYVTKDIVLGNDCLGYETISDIGQSFHVPEPMTLALFGTGLLGLGLVQRRRVAA